MLGGVELALGLSKGSLQLPFYTRVQLWYDNAHIGHSILLTLSLIHNDKFIPANTGVQLNR
jgi:hypothetical protein